MSLVSRVVGLFTPRLFTKLLGHRQATRTTSQMLKAEQERKLCSQCTHFFKAGAARKVSIQFKLLISKTVRSYSFAIDNISRVLLSLLIF